MPIRRCGLALPTEATTPGCSSPLAEGGAELDTVQSPFPEPRALSGSSLARDTAVSPKHIQGPGIASR